MNRMIIIAIAQENCYQHYNPNQVFFLKFHPIVKVGSFAE